MAVLLASLLHKSTFQTVLATRTTTDFTLHCRFTWWPFTNERLHEIPCFQIKIVHRFYSIGRAAKTMSNFQCTWDVLRCGFNERQQLIKQHKLISVGLKKNVKTETHTHTQRSKCYLKRRKTGVVNVHRLKINRSQFLWIF